MNESVLGGRMNLEVLTPREVKFNLMKLNFNFKLANLKLLHRGKSSVSSDFAPRQLGLAIANGLLTQAYSWLKN